MSFAGDLEHLPIVDLIQLLHTTRKSGTLILRGRRGESQLVFSDGYIVSANHCDNNVRIGKILVEAGAIDQTRLEQTLQAQAAAGAERKPLIAMLLEGGLVPKKELYKGLEQLIELTVVDVLTWRKGTFALDVEQVAVSDEYRYFPEILHEEIILNTQSVLMDALRIYDEKRRDGQLSDEEDVPEDDGVVASGEVELSADLLGLADLDQLERRIPTRFIGLEDRDPAKVQREKLAEFGLEAEAPELEPLVTLLAAAHAVPTAGEAGLSVVLFSADPLLAYTVTTVLKPHGALVLSCTEEQDLGPFIEQFSGRQRGMLVVLDGAQQASVGADRWPELRRRCHQVAALQVVELAPLLEPAAVTQAYADGVRAVLPRPPSPGGARSFGEFVAFLEMFAGYLAGLAASLGGGALARLGTGLRQLRQARAPQEVAAAALQCVATVCNRAVSFVVSDQELMAQQGCNLQPGGGMTPVELRLPLQRSSQLQQVVMSGEPYQGVLDVAELQPLFAAIGAPAQESGVLLPLCCYGATLCLVYGDGAAGESAALPAGLLELLASQAGLALENAQYRKNAAKPGR